MRLTYDLLKNWKVILLSTFLISLFYQAIIYLHPENLDWVGSKAFSYSNLFYFLFIDQFLIEIWTISILFFLIRLYARKWKLNRLELTLKDLLLYELKFLPLLLLAFLFFAPFSLSLRYFLHHFPDWKPDIYFNQYFYSWKIYINYLPVVLMAGYAILNVNLLRLYQQQLDETRQDLVLAQKPQIQERLAATDELGQRLLKPNEIAWIERIDRKTFAFIPKEKLRLKENLSELEAKLDPDKFVRINRSTLINLDYLHNYSYWENDKYVVRLIAQDREFIMSRNRLKKLKDKFIPQA
ncbi:MAG: LytTR family DNA-binding domain-containing protein [Bacteroidia bacterium]|nr:LytTR family DNA-binding domain-containing protein [Bacteroidia bacterium]